MCSYKVGAALAGIDDFACGSLCTEMAETRAEMEVLWHSSAHVLQSGTLPLRAGVSTQYR